MKKFFILLIVVSCAAVSTLLYKNSSAFQRIRAKSFRIHCVGQFYKSALKGKGVSNTDHPDMAALQDYLSTMDPATGKVPRQKLLTAWRETKAIQSGKDASASLQWTGYSADMGGRTRAMMFDPNDPNHKKVWAGGVTGGLWYNTDIINPSSPWVPVGDFWNCLSVRCITYDPLNPSTFYIGTGEPETALRTYRESSGTGYGIWKSTNGGQTWNLLSSTLGFAYVTKIIIRNEGGNSVLYAGVVSGLYHGTQQSTPSDGLYRSTDDGITWQQVLPNIPGQTMPFAPSDVVLSQTGRIFVGTMANLQDKGAATLLYSDTGLPGSWNVNETYRNEILVDTAKQIPGRVVLACSASDPAVVYALIAQGFTSSFNGFNYFYCYRIYRSENNGVSWTRKNIPPDANSQRNFATIAWHALDVAIDPNNSQNVLIGGLDVQKTTDGGNSWDRVSDWAMMYYGGGPEYVHADQHLMVFRPGSSTELILGTDGGVFYCGNITATFPAFEERNKNYSTLQFYTGAIHPEAGKDEFLGGLQDNGSLRYTGTPLWITDMVSGGDGAFCFYDTDEPQYSISSVYYNQYLTFDNQIPQNYITDYYQSGIFVNPADYDYNSNTLYANACDFGGNYVDHILRINDIVSYGYWGTFVPVNTGTQTYFSAVKWSPFSSFNNSIVYLGTQSGQLFRISNAQQTPVKTEITGSNFPTGTIISIDVLNSEDTLLVTFSNYGIPSVFVTYDGGDTWFDREGNLPDMPVRWGIFHPQNSGQAMLATETGIWTTKNLHQQNVVWTPDVNGMANVRVDMLDFRESDNTVLAASHGRGFFTTTWDVVSGIDEPVHKDFKLYPNPTSGLVNLSWNSTGQNNIKIIIYNPSGKIVYEEIKTSTGRNLNKQIDLSALPVGIYFFTLCENGNQVRTEKIIKQ